MGPAALKAAGPPSTPTARTPLQAPPHNPCGAAGFFCQSCWYSPGWEVGDKRGAVTAPRNWGARVRPPQLGADVFAYLDLGVVVFVLAVGFGLGALFGWNLYGSFGRGDGEELCEVVDLAAYRLQVSVEADTGPME
jgi:hypothetical protein